MGKLIGLLLLFCPPPSLYFVFENSKNLRKDLGRPVMGTIFLVDLIERTVICFLHFVCSFLFHVKKFMLKYIHLIGYCKLIIQVSDFRLLEQRNFKQKKTSYEEKNARVRGPIDLR